jgi:hypothetical protein
LIPNREFEFPVLSKTFPVKRKKRPVPRKTGNYHASHWKT